MLPGHRKYVNRLPRGKKAQSQVAKKDETSGSSPVRSGAKHCVQREEGKENRAATNVASDHEKNEEDKESQNEGR